MNYAGYVEKWQGLMSRKRFAEGNVSSPVQLAEQTRYDGRSPFERDFGRIVFSQPFRRLAGKTQVHPFATVDYIHNRLTHTMEVAYISRSLGRLASKFMLSVRGDLTQEKQMEEIGWICQAAGFMHDIGNPPYGHAGESAIRAWASNNQNELCDACGEFVYSDFSNFDGNAQAFRMACRPDMRESCYYQLTAATLGAMIKYPWSSQSEDGSKKKKSTAFSTEEIYLKELWKELGLDDKQRHPLSYLTEAADDICYRINDFEDAVIMGLFDGEHVRKMLLEGMTFEERQKHLDDNFATVRSASIGFLIKEFSGVFQREYDSIMRGAFKGSLQEHIDDRWGGVLNRIKKEYNIIFSERKKVISEIGSYGQIARVLDKYLEFLKEIKANRSQDQMLPDFDGLSFLAQRLVTLAWGGRDYYDKHRPKAMDWWGHAVLDFVVGMTDDYLHRVAMEFM